MKIYKHQYVAIVLALLLAGMSIITLAAEPSPKAENPEIGGTPQSKLENSTEGSTPPQDPAPETSPQDPAPETSPQGLTPETSPQHPPPVAPPQTRSPEEKEKRRKDEKEEKEAARAKREAEQEKKEAKREQREQKKEAEKAKKAENAAVPILQITRGTLPDNIGAEQNFQLQLTVNNLSSTENIENLTLKFSTSEALLLLDTGTLKVINSLNAGTSADLTLDMQTTKAITAAAQFVTAELKYDYLPAGSGIRKNNSATEKILIPLTPTEEKKKLSSATPGLIISKYDYGEEPIPVGSVFNLKLAFRNTSQKLPVENVVMQLEMGEAFSITASSNAFFFPKLEAGEKREQDIQVQALASAKPESNKIAVLFNYEYVDQDTREKANVSEKLAIPIFQPDRFEVTPPRLPESIVAGQESILSFPYVNKGRSELYNMEASLEGNANMLNPHQNLGNFEAGKSGTIDFVVMPQDAGEITLTAKILYEDANMNQKEVKVPVKLTVIEPEPTLVTEPEDIGRKGNTPNKWLLWVLAGLVMTPITLAALIKKIKKCRLRKASENAAREESESADEAELNWEGGKDNYAE